MTSGRSPARASALPARPGSACGIGPMGAGLVLGRASGLPTAPDSAFFLGHGDAAGVQCGFSRAVRGPLDSTGATPIWEIPGLPRTRNVPPRRHRRCSQLSSLPPRSDWPSRTSRRRARPPRRSCAGVSRALPLLEKGSAGDVAQDRDWTFRVTTRRCLRSRSTWPADVAFRKSRRRQPGRTDRTDASPISPPHSTPTRRARVRVGG